MFLTIKCATTLWLWIPLLHIYSIIFKKSDYGIWVVSWVSGISLITDEWITSVSALRTDIDIISPHVLNVFVFVYVDSAMRQPRCGVPDRRAADMDDGARKKRYALTGQQWDKDHITYRFVALQCEYKPTRKQNV